MEQSVMSSTELEQFFELLLAEQDGSVEGSSKSAARAALLAHLKHLQGGPAGSDDISAAKLAAYISGALAPAEVDRFVAELVRTPNEIYELEAAQSFLD